mgnify:CR=1 FL=1
MFSERRKWFWRTEHGGHILTALLPLLIIAGAAFFADGIRAEDTSTQTVTQPANPSDEDIIGGRPANQGEFPSYGELPNCGSTLLYEGSDLVVPPLPSVSVTDGHCVTTATEVAGVCAELPDDASTTIGFGSTETVPETFEKQIKTTKIVVHPEYLNTCNPNFDIALLIGPPVHTSPLIHPARIIPQNTQISIGTSLTFAGTGLISYTPSQRTNTLLTGKLPVVACDGIFGNANNLICTSSTRGLPENPSDPDNADDICFGIVAVADLSQSMLYDTFLGCQS